jgi:hypothetical protein
MSEELELLLDDGGGGPAPRAGRRKKPCNCGCGGKSSTSTSAGAGGRLSVDALSAVLRAALAADGGPAGGALDAGEELSAAALSAELGDVLGGEELGGDDEPTLDDLLSLAESRPGLKITISF